MKENTSANVLNSIMNKTLLFGMMKVATAAALAGAGCGSSAPVYTTPAPANQTSQTPGPDTTPAPSGYTMADVQKHNSGTSCWTTINGNVYDVTTWINQHPGGRDAILSLCGIDGSSAFNNQHGGQGRPESELATFKIGALIK